MSAQTRRSKFLSLLLRHEPEKIGLKLDAAGWVEVHALLTGLAAHGKPMSRETLLDVVASSAKQRFALSDDGLRIRASQGHSIDVELGYEASEPPEQLFHGTVAAAVSAIEQEGLSKMGRHHVHLSGDRETAEKVGQRRGVAIVLLVAARAMSEQGHCFYRSENGVWLTDWVPRAFLTIPASERIEGPKTSS